MEKPVRYFKKIDKPELQPVYIMHESDKFISLSNGDTVLKTVFHNLYEDSSNDEIDPKQFLNSTNFGKKDTLFKENIENNPKTNKISDTVTVENDIIRIDNTQNEIDELFNDEVQVYGVEEATKRKRDRIKRGINTTKNPVMPQPEKNGTVQINGVVQETTQPQYIQQTVDPSEMMFKTFKRNHEITITLDFKDKIGNPDFVRMMLENIDGDIISYYKRLIMDNIMTQVNRIEREVEKQLRMEIFGTSEDEPMSQDDLKPNIEVDKKPKMDENLSNDNKPVVIVNNKKEDDKEKKVYINEKGKKVTLLPKNAEKKGYKLFEDGKDR
jgi:hypothetical protein